MNKFTPEHASTVAMVKRVYAIRDDKMREYQSPVLIVNDAVASRSFGDLLSQDRNSPMVKHAGDFSLWYLGDFNAESGLFSSKEEPHIVCRASDFVIEEK
jgi:hypothetical protein